ncbi:MAG: glycosyltransferase [Synechococcales cyanobacterium C42_A2020_086]|jgi:hypothetical protein|nr:glycosyltransferase [Synechococcales cyanobacterium M58_A2018_015]MBF2073399.1 glycosyltransferase [Synechococcales cyanobacterium C42_A2020_086]
MNLFVLSELNPHNNHIGWSVTYGLEAVLASSCQASFLYPQENNTLRLSNGIELTDRNLPLVQRCRQRLQRFNRSWFSLDERPTLGKGPNVLLVIGLSPYFLLSMHALGPQLKQFDLRLGYILDGFDLRWIDRTLLPYLDHLFVMSAEMAEDVQTQFGIPSTFIPIAIDTFSSLLPSQPRWIDIIYYGRGNKIVHQTLHAYFNRPASERLYYHSTFINGEVTSPREHIALMQTLLQRSKISLCFEASSIARFQGYSPILYRWFEGWLAGCTIVGKKPFGKGVASLMDWDNSTLDLPDSPDDSIPFLESLLEDEETLLLNAHRNYHECLLRHDWRYRIRDLLMTVGLPLPEPLNDDIALLRKKAYGSIVPLPRIA